MGPAPRHGHGLVQYQLRLKHAQPLTRAMNARIVDSVGIETRQILLMVNTSSPGRAANCRASICPIDKSLKLQAPSSKPQAPSVRQIAAATLCHIDTICSGATKRLFMHYFVFFNKDPWYNVILTIKKEK